VGVPDDINGQAINAIMSLRTAEDPQDIESALVMKVRIKIGPFAAPKRILIVKDLPKTRSGKIVRGSCWRNGVWRRLYGKSPLESPNSVPKKLIQK
jgi:acyl-CoA synthetase (AMP-forming)/AMP-acid ligase II